MDAEISNRSLFSASIAPLRFFWPWVLFAVPPRYAFALFAGAAQLSPWFSSVKGEQELGATRIADANHTNMS
jgi:hypothetical protein